jgi:hypothetical protein
MASENDTEMMVEQLRTEGLTDAVIMEELTKKGMRADKIHAALTGAGGDGGAMPGQPPMPGHAPMPGMMHEDMSNFAAEPMHHASSSGGEADGNLYERIEEITEGMIDEKWEELIGEVRKIVEWKEKMEEQQTQVESDLAKLKEDFKVLHQGVLGKLETYDQRMGNVDTELKAVGKVFKDVVPQFVENVKELSSITNGMKR